MDPHAELLSLLNIEGHVPRLEEALTHASFVNETPNATSYEKLEFLGDAVLGLCVAEILIEAVPAAREGRLTRMRASLVSTEALSSFAREVDLVRFVRFGRGAATSGDAHQPKVLADVVESIVAAVFLAQGLDAARSLTRLIVGDTVLSPVGIAERDPKSKLQEFVQRGGEQAPTYRLVDVSGPDHDHQFDVEVVVNGAVLGRGSGRTKKLAEREAARAALETLQHATGESP